MSPAQVSADDPPPSPSRAASPVTSTGTMVCPCEALRAVTRREAMGLRFGIVFATVSVVVVLAAGCSGASRGESCGDKGIIGGDCGEGLQCWNSKDDDVSPLVCLKPCTQESDCLDTENCTGENPKVCRPN